MTRRKHPGPSIAEVKAAVRKRDGFCCTKCGFTNQEHLAEHNRQLDVHRVKPGSLYTVEGCITVCRVCHGRLPKRTKGEADQGHNGRQPLCLFISQPIIAALRAYLDSTRPREKKTSVIETALQDFLANAGFWPPTQDGAS